MLTVKDISVTVDGVKLLDKVYFSVGRTDKIAFVGENELAQTALFKVLMGELEPEEGSIKWGVSTIRSYLPKDNTEYFEGNEMELVDCCGSTPPRRTMCTSGASWAGCCSPMRMCSSM